MLGVALTFSVLGTVNANATYDLSGQHWNHVRVKKTTLSDSDFSGSGWSSPPELWVNFTVDANGSIAYAPTQRGIATQTPTISVTDGTSILYRGVAYWN